MTGEIKKLRKTLTGSLPDLGEGGPGKQPENLLANRERFRYNEYSKWLLRSVGTGAHQLRGQAVPCVFLPPSTVEEEVPS